MKKYILLALLLMVATLQTALAQGFRVYKSDGTVAQFSLRTDSIVFYDGLGSDVDFGPFTPVNQCIAGKWYRYRKEYTFSEDGKTNYPAGTMLPYKFMPYQGKLIVYRTNGTLRNILHVYDLTADTLVVGAIGSTGYSVLTRTSQPQPVTSITLNDDSLSMQPDTYYQLTATVLPADADNPAVAWTSSNADVASVYEDGLVRAKKNGSCIITCSAKDGSGVKATCKVTVHKLVTDITVSPATLTLEPEETQTLTATVLPSDATNKQLTWSSDKTDVATVDQDGNVIAVAEGECTITATSTDGSEVKGTCEVTVKSKGINGHEYVEIGGLKWATMNVGATTIAGSYETCFGDYFAWGETEPRYASITRTSVDEASFTWRNGYSSGYGGDNYPTYTGTTLDAAHDAATTNWGSSWRTPKREDFMALAKACSGSDSDEQTPVNLINTITEGGIYWLSSTQAIESAYTGVAGLLFVSKSDISMRVFFPACGLVDNTGLCCAGAWGCFWSSTLSSSINFANDLYFESSWVYPSAYGHLRSYGFPVRPVSD